MDDLPDENRLDKVPEVTEPANFVVALWKQARRVVVFVIGSTVLLIGIILIVAPGPAVIVIPLGLSILATEFVWARKWLNYAKQQMDAVAKKTFSQKPEDPPGDH
jgi:tellurite resistance protein TerC